VIDCPPNIGLLTLNALVSSDLVLIPVQCEFYPMEGLPTLLKVMDLVRSRLKAAFDYRIILTMYDRRTALSRRVMQQVNENFGERVSEICNPQIRPDGRGSKQKVCQAYSLSAKKPRIGTIIALLARNCSRSSLLQQASFGPGTSRHPTPTRKFMTNPHFMSMSFRT